MKIGDLVKVKDACAYISQRKRFIGHVGIVMDMDDVYCDCPVHVFICGVIEKILLEDLEIV